MPRTNGYQQSILWDETHILIVNYSRREMYLYENAGGEPGVFHIRTAEAGARADITDPFDILDMAVRFAIRFELLARVLDAEVVRVLEAIGVKDFLTKLVDNTTDELRRKRFTGLSFFEFTVNEGTNGASPQDEIEHDDEEDDAEEEEVATASPVNAVKARRGRPARN